MSVIAARKTGRHLAPRKVTAPLTEIAQVVVSESMQRRTAVVATAGGILISAFAPANGAFAGADNTDTHDLTALRAEVDAFLAEAAPEHVAPTVVVNPEANLQVESLLTNGVAAVDATPAPEGFVSENASVALLSNRMGVASRTSDRIGIAALDGDLVFEDIAGDAAAVEEIDNGFVTLPADITPEFPIYEDPELPIAVAPELPDYPLFELPELPIAVAPEFPEFPIETLPIIPPPVIAIPAPEPEPEPEPIPVAPVAPAPVAPVAPPAAVNPPPAQNTAPPASVEGNAILEKAATLVGTPYRLGGTSRNGFDCSGFTQYVFGALGVDLPRTSRAQMNAGTVVSRSEAQPGDLIWSPGHIAIYAGNGTQIDAPRPGRSVQFRNIWQRNPVFIRVS